MKFHSPTGQPMQISLVSGHTIVITPEGNEVPAMFRREAIARGAVAEVEGDAGSAPAPKAQFDRGQIVADALNAMLDGVKPEANPNVRWLLLVAHDTNIAMVRTLMNFSWQLPGYSRGNIPPGSSLVLERWRNAKSGERYLRVYFQAQGLDDLRRLQTPDAQHPMLRQEWRQPGCRQTDVGTLCPFQAAITALGQRIDRSSAPAVAMVLP